MMPTTQELLRSPLPIDWNDPNRPVSSRSRWSDHVWRLDSVDPAVPASGIGVYWWSERDGKAPPTERQAETLEQLKRAAWIGLSDPTLPFCNKPTSVSDFAVHAHALVMFMHDCGPGRLAQFDRVAAERYQEWIVADVQKHIGTEPEEAIRRRIKRRLNVISNVWTVRARLAAVGVTLSASDPLGGIRAGSIASRLADRAFNALPALPSEVHLAVLNAATNIVAVHSADVLRTQDAWFASTNGSGTAADRRLGRAAISRLKFETGGRTATWWPIAINDPEIASVNHGSTAGLRTLVTAVRDACILVLLGTAGLRLTEIAAILGGRSDPEGLPDCIKTELSEDGLIEVFKVDSKLTKGQAVPLPESWVIGCRPAGTSSLPLAVAAIDLLERLMSPWRPMSTDEQARMSLAVAFDRGTIPTSAKGMIRLTPTLVRQSMIRFYSKFVPFKDLPDRSAGIRGEDLRPYRNLRGANIYTSQYRKSYSQFLLRMDSGLLPAIQAQFKHMRIATTQTSYTGNDPRVLGDADDEQRLAANRTIAAMLGREVSVSGRLKEIIGSVEQETSDRWAGVEELTSAEDAAKLGLSLLPVEHGWCGILFAPHRSRCNQMAGTASALNRRPSETFRNPTTCGGCPLFAVDAQSAPYWRRRFETNRRIWEGRPAGRDADYQVALARMRQAAGMLRSLGEET